MQQFEKCTQTVTTNSLLGVLIHFYQVPVPIVANIEQMFDSFKVEKEHRDFLRFLAYKNNDPTAEIIEYRRKVHIFGNKSSPAVANHGLHKTVWLGCKGLCGQKLLCSLWPPLSPKHRKGNRSALSHPVHASHCESSPT